MNQQLVFQKKTNEALSVYETEAEAQQSADYQCCENGRSLYPYHCERCGLWHLAPTETRINVLHNACSCIDSCGKHKDLYLSREDAEKAKSKCERERGYRLYIYECPRKNGFHLTKSQC